MAANAIKSEFISYHLLTFKKSSVLVGCFASLTLLSVGVPASRTHKRDKKEVINLIIIITSRMVGIIVENYVFFVIS